MGKHLPDPEIEALVQEMNRPAESADGETSHEREGVARDLDEPGLRNVLFGEALESMLLEMADRDASDLILIPGSQPVVRVNGELLRLDRPAVEGEDVRTLFGPHIGARSRRHLEESGSADFSLNLAADEKAKTGLRLRVNIQRQGGRLAVAVRALPRKTLTLDELQLPGSLVDLARPTNGLVLVCGPTGSGKSTTIAALLDHLNRTQFRHVITIEEPVEYEHSNQNSLAELVRSGTVAVDEARSRSARLDEFERIISH